MSAKSDARSSAIKKLGKEDDYINLSGLNAERTNAQNIYNTTYNALQNEFNNLLETAERNKLNAKSDFRTGREAVAYNDYMNTRGKTGVDLSSRGTSSGLGSLGKLGSIIQTNKSNSDLANTYYNSMADIQRDIDTGTQTHNYNVENLKNQLAQQMANIGAREAAARNSYRTAVAQLAEQIQSRWDSKKYYDNQLKLQNQALQSQYASQFVNDNKNTDSQHIIDEANKVVSQGGAVLRDGTEVTNISQALNWLQENGRFRMTDLQNATNKSIENSRKKNNISLKDIFSTLFAPLGPLGRR